MRVLMSPAYKNNIYQWRTLAAHSRLTAVSDAIRPVQIRFWRMGHGQIVRILKTVVGMELPQSAGPGVRYWHPAHKAIGS